MPPPPRRNIELIESLEEHARDYQALLRVARVADECVVIQDEHAPMGHSIEGRYGRWMRALAKLKEALKEVEHLLDLLALE